MRSPATRRTVVIIMVVILLAPGLLQAKPAMSGPVSDLSFFSMAWNLLTAFWAPRSSDGFSAVKNGGQAEPSGGTTGGGTGGAGGSSATSGEGGGGDNGGQAEPNG